MSIHTFAILLCAGRSRRFGRQKLLANWRGQPLVQHAIDTAQEVLDKNVVLVTGSGADAIGAAVNNFRGQIVYNENYRDGLGSSIATGVRAVKDNATAIVVMLADQPLVSADHLRQIVGAFSECPNHIVATDHLAVSGPPVLFGSAYFDQLQRLENDRGAKQLLEDHAHRVLAIPFEAASFDVDTRDDLDELNRRYPTR